MRRGSAPYVEWLGAVENPTGIGWAYLGKDYGKSIMRDYLTQLLAVQVPDKDGQLQILRAENEQLRKELETVKAENNEPLETIKKIHRLVKPKVLDV